LRRDSVTSAVDRVEALYGRLLDALALCGCVLLFVMMLVICIDVLLRNVPVIPSMRGFPASNDLTEYALYLVTLLMAPSLLRRGQHIRVDILLRAIPRHLAWGCEWVVDVMAFLCCLVMAWYGIRATAASYLAGALTIKSLVTPEWWSLAPLPVTFVLLAAEVLFRVHRLAGGPRGPRDDAVSSA
jgi:TRAP-type C4-dicarboxylate transport system permease small subunit